jgi:hypothetical protein
MFTGIGMKKGDGISGLVGWEFHGDPAEGTALSGGTRPVHWTATIYPGSKNNFVFNASTIWWAQGLASPRDICRRGRIEFVRMAPMRECSGLPVICCAGL